MKHRWTILATVGMLVLCVITLGLLTMPDNLTAPAPQRVDLPLKLLANTTPAVPKAAAEQTTPPREPAPSAVSTQSAQTDDGVVTGPDGCVLLGTPNQVHFLPEDGLTLMTNGGGVYVFNATSGDLIWHRYIWSDTGSRGSTLGSKHVLIWCEEDLRLLEAATGREVWSQNNASYGRVQWALLSADDAHIAVYTEEKFVIYSVNGGERRALTRDEGSWPWDWLPDGKTLVTLQRKREGELVTQNWTLTDADTGETVGTWGSPGLSEFVSRPSKSGQFIEKAKNDAKGETEKNSVLKIRDVRTGNVLRECNTDEPVPNATWLADGRRFMSLDEDRRTLRVIDSETGKLEFTLSKEGHCFSRTWMSNDNSEREWAISQDESNAWYAWPLTPDGTPQKILSGRGIAEGSYYFRDPPTEYILMDRPVGKHLWVHTVYSISDMRKLAEWRVRSDEDWYLDTMVSRNLTRLVRMYPIDPKNMGSQWDAKDMAFNVCAPNAEAPVFRGQGRPLDISPDGRHLAVQNSDGTVSLYDLETGLVAQQYHLTRNGEDRVYCSAAFSDDSSRMALMSSGEISVTDLTEGYPRRMLDAKREHNVGWRFMLSPDGSRVLFGGSGKAWLFDADTGALLRTFEEPERFAQRYGGGFWNGLSARAGDWMGTISERFKSGAFVGAAFAEHATRVITYAAGQVIRVWDADSGSLLRTIHTNLPEQRDEDGRINNWIRLSPNGAFAFSFNSDGYGVSSLWSLSDGALLRRYQLPGWEDGWPRALVFNDASSIYMTVYSNLYRWPGILAGSSHAVVEGAGK